MAGLVTGACACAVCRGEEPGLCTWVSQAGPTRADLARAQVYDVLVRTGLRLRWRWDGCQLEPYTDADDQFRGVYYL